MGPVTPLLFLLPPIRLLLLVIVFRTRGIWIILTLTYNWCSLSRTVIFTTTNLIVRLVHIRPTMDFGTSRKICVIATIGLSPGIPLARLIVPSSPSYTSPSFTARLRGDFTRRGLASALFRLAANQVNLFFVFEF